MNIVITSGATQHDIRRLFICLFIRMILTTTVENQYYCNCKIVYEMQSQYLDKNRYIMYKSRIVYILNWIRCQSCASSLNRLGGQYNQCLIDWIGAICWLHLGDTKSKADKREGLNIPWEVPSCYKSLSFCSTLFSHFQFQIQPHLWNSIRNTIIPITFTSWIR